MQGVFLANAFSQIGAQHSVANFLNSAHPACTGAQHNTLPGLQGLELAVVTRSPRGFSDICNLLEFVYIVLHGAKYLTLRYGYNLTH